MSLTQRIRVLAESTFERQAKETGHPPAPDMRPFLTVPLRERLVLLAIYDSRSMEEIKAAYPWAKETDVRLTSHRIREALSILFAAFEDPTAWIDAGPLPERESPADLGDPEDPRFTDFPIPTRLIPDDTDRQLRQAFFPSVPLMLFGAHVPASVGKISLQHRAIAYVLTVEELSWDEAMEFFGCSKRQVHTALTDVVEALGG